MELRFLVGSLVLGILCREALACKGCLSLDEHNFDKIASRFHAVLAKFDVAYPYGPKHDTFTKLAEELAANDDLILAQIGVKDYGDKENEDLAKKYGYSKDDFPGLTLFVKDKEPKAFPKETEWSLDNLRNFIRDNSDTYIGLSGCLEEFDKLAKDFMDSKYQKEVLKKAEQAAEKFKDTEIAKIYIKFMQKILENQGFVKKEQDRLLNIISKGKVNEKKKQELNVRLNILKSFSLPKTKEEL